MTKEQIYVHIKSKQEAKEVIKILLVYKQDYFTGMPLNFKTFPYLIFINNWWDIVTLVDDSRTKITLSELEQLLKAEKENLQVEPNTKTVTGIEIPNSSFNPQPHYFNELKHFRSLYELQTVLDLNSYEFDILKRLVRCRKKGQFKEDLKKIKDTVDIYLNEFKD